MSHIVYAHKVGYISDELYKSFAIDGENLTRLINGYIGFLKKSKQGANEPGANFLVRDEPSGYILDQESTLSPDSNLE